MYTYQLAISYVTLLVMKSFAVILYLIILCAARIFTPYSILITIFFSGWSTDKHLVHIDQCYGEWKDMVKEPHISPKKKE